MLNASIVLYQHTLADIESLIRCIQASSVILHLYIVDNSPTPTSEFNHLHRVIYIYTGKNLGYGAAHNIALRETMAANIPFHLILNPDIDMTVEVPEKLLTFANAHSDVGHIMPKITNPDGSTQYLCKLIPTPFDLFIRRLMPPFLFRKSRSTFELRATGYHCIMEVPYLSGCFMFLRTAALEKVGLFDEQFFMYPEDMDLTRRMNRHYKTVFYPEVSVVHAHTRASYRNLKMFLTHTKNLILYFNKWGWCCDKERKQINHRILKSLNLLP